MVSTALPFGRGPSEVTGWPIDERSPEARKKKIVAVMVLFPSARKEGAGRILFGA